MTSETDGDPDGPRSHGEIPYPRVQPPGSCPHLVAEVLRVAPAAALLCSVRHLVGPVDPQTAKQLPTKPAGLTHSGPLTWGRSRVPQVGVEPTTFRLGGGCSIH
jgi:hypothetical protein